jgi:hypothetical protein
VALAAVAATAVGVAAFLWSGQSFQALDALVVSVAGLLSGGVLWSVVHAAVRQAASSREPSLACGGVSARDVRPGRDLRQTRWLRASLAGTMVITGAWGAWPMIDRFRIDAVAPDQLTVLRVDVPQAITLTPSRRDARAALGLDEHPAWDRAVVASVRIREATVPVFGVPTSLATALGLETMPTDMAKAWPTRWPRWLGVPAPSQLQSVNPRDAEALVTTMGAVPAAAAMLPPGLLVTDPTFSRAFPLHEGRRYWYIVASAADVDAIAAALRQRLSVHGVVTRAPRAMPEGWRVR